MSETITILNKGLQRVFDVKVYTLMPNESITLSNAEASRLRRDAVELQKPSPGADPFHFDTKGDITTITNISSQIRGLAPRSQGTMARMIQFHVPRVFLRQAVIDKSSNARGINVLPSRNEIAIDDLAEIFKNEKFRNQFLSLMNDPDGISCKLPDDPRFTQYL